MKEVHIQQREINKWTAKDFVKFFNICYTEVYGERLKINYRRDCAIMWRLINDFYKIGRSKAILLEFIKWVFQTYPKNEKFKEPIKIGFLSYLVKDFLGVSIRDAKEKIKVERQKKPKYSEATKRWLKKQRELYKVKFGKKSS